MTTQQQIENLQRQLEKEKQDLVFIENAKKLLEGKYFLDTSSDRTWGKSIRSFGLYFIKTVKGLKDQGLDIEGNILTIFCDKPKLVHINNYIGELNTLFGHIDIRTSIWMSRFGCFRRNEENIILKKDCIEITKDQAFHILSGLMDIQREVYNKLDNLIVSSKEVTENILDINFTDLLDFIEIEKFLKSNPIPLKEVKSQYRSIISNLFNSNYELESLVQYSLEGKNGLYLKIVGGNGGTDYEPYTTHYYLENVEIRWEEILYPIRQKLNCKVFDLVEKLKNIKSVYSIGNWNITYFGNYDVTFSSASLSENVVGEINSVIKKHLK